MRLLERLESQLSTEKLCLKNEIEHAMRSVIDLFSRFWIFTELFWGLLVTSWGLLGASWGLLEASWGSLVGMLGPPGSS